MFDWYVVNRTPSGGVVTEEGDCPWRFALDTCISMARKGGLVKRTKTSVYVERNASANGAKCYIKFTSSQDKELPKALYSAVVDVTM